MLAGRVSLVVGGEVQGQALIKAIWTDDSALSTRINREVAHYTGQAELAQVIQEGLEARKAGDEDTATLKLGRAVQLAAQTGNDSTTKLLAKVVDVEDAATGTVRLKRKVAGRRRDGPRHPVDQDGAGQPPGAMTATVTCPDGHQSTTTDYCDQCGPRSAARPRPPPGGPAPATPTLQFPAAATDRPADDRAPRPSCARRVARPGSAPTGSARAAATTS